MTEPEGAAQDRICLACRRIAQGAEACEDGHPAPIALLGDARGALVEAVWGPPAAQAATARQAWRAQQRVLAYGTGAAGAALVTATGLGAGPLALLAAVGGGLVGALLARLRAAAASQRYPIGAADEPAARRIGAGRVVAAEGALAPASGEVCAAWAIELRLEGSWGSRTMLRAGLSAGLELELDGGARVVIAPGGLRLHGPTGARLPQLADLENPALEAWLRAIDPARARGAEPCSPLPFNVVGEETLHVGDRVELAGVVEPLVITGADGGDAGGDGGGVYRVAPATALVTRGIPTLRRL
jgi:hypothetical protein